MSTANRAVGQRGAVQSVGRVLDLLEALAGEDTGIGVTRLGHATGLPYATIHRLLATLRERGYVAQDADSRRYTLGPRLIWLGEAAESLYGVWVRPYLSQLVELTGESANMAILEGDHAVYVAQVPSPHTVRMFTQIGNRVMLHSTAVGKVMLAYQSRDLAWQVIRDRGLPERTVNTITDADEFIATLDDVEAQGFAVDSEEEEIGVRCVAVPVFELGGTVAALSISGPVTRLSEETYRDFLPTMQTIAGSVTASLEGDPAEDTGS